MGVEKDLLNVNLWAAMTHYPILTAPIKFLEQVVQ
jgi:hypothetical protein